MGVFIEITLILHGLITITRALRSIEQPSLLLARMVPHVFEYAPALDYTLTRVSQEVSTITFLCQDMQLTGQ